MLWELKKAVCGYAGQSSDLVGGYHPHRAGAFRRADDDGMMLILLRIELDPEIHQPEAYLPSHRRRMLTDSPVNTSVSRPLRTAGSAPMVLRS